LRALLHTAHPTPRNESWRRRNEIVRKCRDFEARAGRFVAPSTAVRLLTVRDRGRTEEAVKTQRLALLLRPNDAELREPLRRMEVVQSKESEEGPE
jgi:hypothetical protein